jgi:hypothetical protein
LTVRFLDSFNPSSHSYWLGSLILAVSYFSFGLKMREITRNQTDADIVNIKTSPTPLQER